MEEETTKHSNSKVYGIFAIAVIVLLTVGIIAVNPFFKNNTSSSQSTESELMVTSSPVVEESQFKDGAYTVTGNYESPGGPEEIGVSLTIQDDIITEVSVEVMAERPISVEKQTDFAANYKEFVIGKPISEVVLSKVSGSSLTPKGFNDAVEQIKQQAAS